jgi:excisionase family DNA binding protein
LQAILFNLKINKMVEILEKLQKQNERLKSIENFLFAQKNVLNLDEVCTLTGLSKSHIYKLTCWGKIPFYKQAKHLYFDRVEIENWLKSNRFKSSDELDKEAATYVTLNKKRGAK